MIGEKIRTLRMQNGLSQEQLAEICGVSRQAISKWERGDSLPDTERLMQLCRSFHVSADFLLFDETTEQQVPDLPQTEVPSKDAEPKRFVLTRAYAWLASVLAALGGLGLLVMWVLSTMIPSSLPVESPNLDGSIGVWMVDSFAFMDFITYYRLGALCWICLVLILVSVGMLLYRLYRSHFPNPEI